MTLESKKLPVVGILGDGQLSMMMTEAYQKIGGQVFVLGSSEDAPASAYADKFIVGDVNDLETLKPFFSQVDVVTLENEFIDSNLLIQASRESETRLFPAPQRYQLIEDKLSENLFFQKLGVGIADFFEVKSEDCLIDEPGYLKLAKGGYDGIGTYKVNNKEQALSLYNKIKDQGVVLFEHLVDFQKELSMIAVSNSDEIIFYPMVETYQEDGTCRFVAYPAGISTEVEKEAQQAVERILNELDTKGLFAFEFFLTKDNQLILNESAPRPHNSGHITLDLMDCSQFENHMRAIAGLELKIPKLLKQEMLMLNLLGTRNGTFDENTVFSSINDDELTVCLYRKTESRVKRKMGHINLWGDNQRQRAEALVKNLVI